MLVRVGLHSICEDRVQCPLDLVESPWGERGYEQRYHLRSGDRGSDPRFHHRNVNRNVNQEDPIQKVDVHWLGVSGQGAAVFHSVSKSITTNDRSTHFEKLSKAAHTQYLEPCSQTLL